MIVSIRFGIYARYNLSPSVQKSFACCPPFIKAVCPTWRFALWEFLTACGRDY